MAWSRDTVVSKIYEAVDRYHGVNVQQYRQIRFALEKLDPAEVFAALYDVLTNTSRESTRSQDQEYVGRLLLGLRPPCPQDPSSEIASILRYYDFSVEEVPQYFREQLGLEALLALLEELSSSINSDHEQRAMETWKWWLRQDPTDARKEY